MSAMQPAALFRALAIQGLEVAPEGASIPGHEAWTLMSKRLKVEIRASRSAIYRPLEVRQVTFTPLGGQVEPTFVLTVTLGVSAGSLARLIAGTIQAHNDNL